MTAIAVIGTATVAVAAASAVAAVRWASRFQRDNRGRR